MGSDLLDAQYPTTWDEYIGQEEAIFQLQVKIASAQRRGTRLGHTLLHSQFPGIGKTALALLIARYMGVTIWPISGAPKPHEVRLILSQMETGSILFIDEIHRLVDGGKGKSEWLLHLAENGMLLGPLGPEKVPDVTIIGATTDRGRLPEPMLDRFEIQPALRAYTDQEAAGIARTMSSKLLATEGLPNLHEDNTVAIATAAAKRPRWVRRIIIGVRDLALTEEIVPTDDGKYDLDAAFAFVGVTEDGLTTEAVAYLKVMLAHYPEPVGAQLLADQLGEVGSGLRYIEQLLLDKDLIRKTARGRMLTMAGLERAKALGA